MQNDDVLLTVYVKMAGGSGQLSALLHREGLQVHSKNGQPNPFGGRWRPSCWGKLDRTLDGIENQLCEVFRSTFGVMPAVNTGTFQYLNETQFGHAPHWGAIIPVGQKADFRLPFDSGGVRFFTRQELCREVERIEYDSLQTFRWQDRAGMFDREYNVVFAGYEALLKQAATA